MDVRSILILVSKSLDSVDDYTKYEIIQTFAHKLEENNKASRHEIRKALRDIGFVLDEYCSGCNEYIPMIRILFGKPICNDCRLDVDSVG